MEEAIARVAAGGVRPTTSGRSPATGGTDGPVVSADRATQSGVGLAKKKVWTGQLSTSEC